MTEPRFTNRQLGETHLHCFSAARCAIRAEEAKGFLREIQESLMFDYLTKIANELGYLLIPTSEWTGKKRLEHIESAEPSIVLREVD